jgi:hypothetical protein
MQNKMFKKLAVLEPSYFFYILGQFTPRFGPFYSFHAGRFTSTSMGRFSSSMFLWLKRWAILPTSMGRFSLKLAKFANSTSP